MNFIAFSCYNRIGIGHKKTKGEGGVQIICAPFSIPKRGGKGLDEVGKKIIKAIGGKVDIGAVKDGLAWANEHYDRDFVRQLTDWCVRGYKLHKKEVYFESYRMALLIAAPHEFDAFMQYLEIDRRPHERFYLPRRTQLKKIVDAMQDLEDGKLDELFVAQPPRTGKTTLSIFFLAFHAGRNTELSNLYCSYSDTVVDTFYDGFLEILTDADTYNYSQVFPEAQLIRTNAKANVMDLGRSKHYPTFTGRPIGGTLNGSCDCTGLWIADDLCSGIEEAMNKDRMIALWQKVDNNLITRAKTGAKMLWEGTRWSMIDPAGLRIDVLENSDAFKDRKWQIVNVPALNERDESNFNYKYNVGFSTGYFRQRRASFERTGDLASWSAQYQGIPIERDGAVFSPDEFTYFDGTLPEEEPDRIFMAIDPAWGGGDFVAGPVCFQYGNTIYVPDVIYSNLGKEKTQPAIAGKVLSNGVKQMYIEGTKTTASFGEGIQKILKENHGYSMVLKTSFKNALGGQASGKNKEQRIFEAASDIKEHMVFLKEGKRPKEYQLFMQNVFGFKITGKNKHDDAPDSLQMAIGYAFPKDAVRTTIRSRSRLGF